MDRQDVIALSGLYAAIERHLGLAPEQVGKITIAPGRLDPDDIEGVVVTAETPAPWPPVAVPVGNSKSIPLAYQSFVLPFTEYER